MTDPAHYHQQTLEFEAMQAPMPSEVAAETAPAAETLPAVEAVETFEVAEDAMSVRGLARVVPAHLDYDSTVSGQTASYTRGEAGDTSWIPAGHEEHVPLSDEDKDRGRLGVRAARLALKLALKTDIRL
jgi:hypothetical protein